MFVEVLRIRWYAMTGEYAAGAVPSPGKLSVRPSLVWGRGFGPSKRGEALLPHLLRGGSIVGVSGQAHEFGDLGAHFFGGDGALSVARQIARAKAPHQG